MKSGLIVLSKPKGLTSHDCVEEIRKLLPGSKVGHGGTLDPLAEGVLPILVNEATKLTPFLADVDKEYVTTLILGVETDTDDAQGKITQEASIEGIDRDKIEEALKQFRGEIEQVPPLYSAIKLHGTPLYKRARRGEKIELKPRKVHISRCDLISVELPHVTLFIHCSRGTYIRALARDLGRALQCGAHLERLERTQFGPFTVGQAVTLEELRKSRGEVEKQMIPLADALSAFPSIQLSQEQTSAVRRGKTPLLKAFDLSLKPGKVKLLGPQGELVAVAEALHFENVQSRMVRLIRVF
ncbi:MAG: tRNA pseudouridine(55) synthase TruB [Deltaproteobacteria bacterium]|nr:tRNA pseudouridine(55) synthase TruB [Deltaproteobacteria bacterium]